MKAADLNVDKMIEFRPEEGKVFFRGARSLILNADALGTLRKDLINTLGLERAKGFLIRYGWQLGYNDGISLKKDFEWDSDEETFIAGSVLFTFEGFAKVINDVVSVDQNEKKVIKKGRFINSFEADQHIRSFGITEQPVCWLLIGYAGGYGSAFLGEKVYYIETKCKGKGDPECEFEGRTLSQWGERIHQELPFYEDTRINEELDNAYQRIQEQNRKLERSLTIHQELYRLVLRSEDLTGITETISQIFKGSVLLFDSTLKELAAKSDTPTNLIKEVKIILTKKISSDTQPDITLVNRILPLEFHVPLNNFDYHGVILPIIAGEDILGFVSGIREKDIEIEQESLILLQRAADIYAVKMMRDKRMIEIENQFRSDFIDSLFNKKYSNINSLVTWGQRLGHNLLIPHYVLAMDIDYDKSNIKSSEKRLLLRKEVLETTTKLLTAEFSTAMCVEFQGKIVVLIPSSKPKEKLADFIHKVNTGLTYLRCAISFGIGGIVYEAEGYYQAYLQACKAIKVIKSFNKKDPVLFFDDLGSLSILLDVNDNTNLLEFMQKKLKPILDYDLSNQYDLITTLEQFLSSENIHKTSELTNLSLSGLKYRLNKIKDFGYNLNSREELFELQLAVKIYKLSSQ